MKTEKTPMRDESANRPSVLFLDNHTELVLDGTLFRVSREFSDSFHLPDLLDTATAGRKRTGQDRALMRDIAATAMQLVGKLLAPRITSITVY